MLHMDISIGVCGPFSGRAAALGLEMKQAIELAVAEKNARGGIGGQPVRVIAYNDESRVDKAKEMAARLSEDRTVLGVIGHYSSDTSLAAAHVYARHAVCLLAPIASNPALTGSGLSNVFRYTNRDDRTAAAISDYLYNQLGKRKAFVVKSDTAYGNSMAAGFATAFSVCGGTVIGTTAIKEGDTDLTALAGSLPGDFDLLFYGGTFEGAPLLKAFRASGYRQLMATGDGCWDVANFLKPAQDVVEKGEGVLVLSASSAIGDVEGSAAFAAAYERRFGNIINYALNSYDCGCMLLQAIEEALLADGANLTARKRVEEALRKIAFRGLANSNPVAWDIHGDHSAAITKLNVVTHGVFREIAW